MRLKRPALRPSWCPQPPDPPDQDIHNAEIAKVKEQITQAKADLAAEDTKMAAERAALDALVQHKPVGLCV